MRKVTFDEIEKVHKYTLNLIDFGLTHSVIEQTYGEGLTYTLTNYYIKKRTLQGINRENKTIPEYSTEGIQIKAINLFPEKEETHVFVDEEKVKI